MQSFHLHLVSDSTGETVSSVARAAIAQFDNVEPVEHIWSLVRTPTQMEKVIAGIKENPGVIMYTLVNQGLRNQIRQYCHQQNLPCIPILARAVTELQAYLGTESSSQPGRQHELNDEYFSRVEAINFALAHDDGQATWELEDADIVLVGVSRTSKSPTCVYLANRGYKAANIPFVANCPLPDNLEQLRRPLIVGLTIDPDHLRQIRSNRLESLHQDRSTGYTDRDQILAELAEAKRLFQKHRWPCIDVTRRSVEETAATIIMHHRNHLERRTLYASTNG